MWGREEVGGRCGRVYGVSVEGLGKCVGVWGEVWGDMWEMCREVCWGFPLPPQWCRPIGISPFTSP